MLNERVRKCGGHVDIMEANSLAASSKVYRCVEVHLRLSESHMCRASQLLFQKSLNWSCEK